MPCQINKSTQQRREKTGQQNLKRKGLSPMKMFYNGLALLLFALAMSHTAGARELYITGSSTVYPFSRFVSDQLVQQNEITAPLIEVTGSGKGIKTFCSSNSMDSPDVVNASRRMRTDEFKNCAQNGVDVGEMLIGYDGAVFVQNSDVPTMELSTKSIFLALAKMVPSKDGSKLINNPYHYWDEIDASLPHREIMIYGPPLKSGTRDLIHEIVMQPVSHEIPLYHQAGLTAYHEFRQDGLFIDDHEDHQKVINLLADNTTAIAFFGYSNYTEHRESLAVNSVAGSLPDQKSITSMAYPLSRPLYFYYNRNHLAEVKDLDTYIQRFMSDEMIGADGACQKIGMVALPDSMLKAYQLWLKYGNSVTEQQLEKSI